MEEVILGVSELAGDRVVELRVVGLITCEWEGDVVAVVAPLDGVAQVVSHGVKVVGVHGEEGKEKDEVQGCSVLHVAHVVLCVVVLVGVGRVTVVIVHIGLEDVVVVIQFCVAIFVVIFCIRRCTLYMFPELCS